MAEAGAAATAAGAAAAVTAAAASVAVEMVVVMEAEAKAAVRAGHHSLRRATSHRMLIADCVALVRILVCAHHGNTMFVGAGMVAFLIPRQAPRRDPAAAFVYHQF